MKVPVAAAKQAPVPGFGVLSLHAIKGRLQLLRPDGVVLDVEHTARRGVAGGYASLGSTALVPTSQLGTGTADSSTYLRGDGTWDTPAGGGGGGAPTGAEYLTLATNGSLTHERVLTPSAPLSGTDGGAGAAYTLSLSGWSGTTDGDMLYRNGTTVDSKTPAQARTWLDIASLYQPLDADLTALAALGDGIPVRTAGTWAASTADTVVSDAAGANGIVVRTSAGAVTARTVTAGDGITITNGDGVSGNPTIAVQQSVKGFQLYQLFTVIQPQGVSVPNVDGVGATITSSGLYSVNPSEAGFPCTQYGDASAAGSRFYVLGYFRIEAATMTTDILFKMGSDISAGITVVHIGFSSSTSVGSADPTGHRYTIRWARGTDTNWQLSVKDGTTQTLVDTGVAVTADYYYAVRFVASTASVAVQISAGSTVATAKSGIDAAGTTSTSSNLPLSANDLYAIFSMQRSAASTSRCLKFGYWRTIQVP